MVVFNYSGAEINAKVVYYGPALSGKTTNLEYIYEKMPVGAKGKMVSMKTRTDRTLFFDFLPLELGEISGYRTRILLYTVPGQVYYNATRKLVLKGADAVVFVADSSPSKIDENIESLHNLEENLNEHELTLDTIPWVIQYNKRDVEGALSVKALSDKLNPLNVPVFESVAREGRGVYETFQAIAGMLYGQLIERLSDTQPPRKKSEKAGTRKAAGAPKAPDSEKGPANADEERSVTDVVDVALREVDHADAPAPPQSRSSKKPRGESKKRPAKDKPGDQEKNMDEIDEEVGRVVNLEDTETSKAERPSPGEFVLDPFQSGKTGEAKQGVEAPKVKEGRKAPTASRTRVATAPPPAVPPPLEEGDEVSITVPVLITRSQMKKTIPLKVKLDIQVIDEEG